MKPILFKITPFDAHNEQLLKIHWTGNQAYSNRVIIMEADTEIVVYDHTISSFVLSHTVQALSLVNGKNYIAQCQIFDREGIPSELSDKVYFYTFTTPTFEFSNVVNDQVIESASYEARVSYNQIEGEDIFSYKFILYNSSKIILFESDLMYETTDIAYTYKGLDCESEYYLRCEGVTVNGMPIDTGFYKVITRYENPSMYSNLYVENRQNEGYISLSTNIIFISYNGDEVFSYDNDKIILSSDKKLYYDSGFSISNNFTVRLEGTRLNQPGKIMVMNSSAEGSVELDSVSYNGKLVFRLTSKSNPLLKYVLYSEPITVSSEDTLIFLIKRINDVYQLQIKKGA